MLYVLDSVTIRNYVEQTRMGSTCAQVIIETPPGPRDLATAAYADILDRAFVDLPGAFPTREQWSSDPVFGKVVRTGATPELPILGVLRSEYLARTNNAKRWRERGDGRIVVSPMTRSSFALHDIYDTSDITSGVRVPFTANAKAEGMDCPGSWRTWCRPLRPGFVWRAPRLRAHEGDSPYFDSTDSLKGYYLRVSDSEASKLKGRFGHLSQAHIDRLHERIRGAVQSAPFPKGLITKVVADTRSGTYDLLTDLAEAKSTLQTIYSCILRILRLYIDTKNRTRELGRLIGRSKKDVLDAQVTAYNNQWLEFRYGITPIVLSINSALEWLNNDSAYAKYRTTTTTNVVVDTGDFKCTVPVTYRAFGKVRVEGPTGGLKLNPLRTALELVPMSLLLNWVCNIGDVLSAVWPPAGAKEEVYTKSISIPAGLYQAEYMGEKVSVQLGFYECTVISNPLDHIEFVTELNVGWRRFVDAFAFAYGPLKALVRK